MPKQINEGSYECSICHKRYINVLYALGCEKSHNLIYVPLKREDLSRLIQFIYTKEDQLLTSSLMETLMKYSTIKEDSTVDMSEV